uniref:Uncharacterized protein n=1 Tax=Tanacetum cinerariifolium TaxID=118510 RepID=A0A699HBV3_TANCI|nr:hypothetical protein [Tanacetum cinerariifolium]
MPLSADQGDWLDDTDEEPDEQEREAHYMYMVKIQEVLTIDSRPIYDVVPLEKVQSDDDYNVFTIDKQHSEQPEPINDTYVVETVDRNVTPDSSNMCDHEGPADQNAKEHEDERVLLASLIANLILDVDENKKSQKQLKKANMFLTQELKKSKQDLEKSKQGLEITKQDLSYCKSELEKYKIFQTNHKDNEKAKLECAKALGLLEETKRLHNESSKTQSYTTFCVKKENSNLVNQISAHESKISKILKEKEQLKKDFKERENKDIDKLIA